LTLLLLLLLLLLSLLGCFGLVCNRPVKLAAVSGFLCASVHIACAASRPMASMPLLAVLLCVIARFVNQRPVSARC